MRTRNTPHTLDSLKELTQDIDGCHIWQGAVKDNGYGVVRYHNKQEYIHRLMYRLIVGEIPPGTEIDHTCNQRACCNPEHLRVVTHQQNMELGASRRTTCRNGHEWNEANTYITTVKRKQGGVRMQRYCRPCRAKHQDDLRKRKDNKGGLIK